MAQTININISETVSDTSIAETMSGQEQEQDAPAPEGADLMLSDIDSVDAPSPEMEWPTATISNDDLAPCPEDMDDALINMAETDCPSPMDEEAAPGLAMFDSPPEPSNEPDEVSSASEPPQPENDTTVEEKPKKSRSKTR